MKLFFVSKLISCSYWSDYGKPGILESTDFIPVQAHTKKFSGSIATVSQHMVEKSQRKKATVESTNPLLSGRLVERTRPTGPVRGMT